MKLEMLNLPPVSHTAPELYELACAEMNTTSFHRSARWWKRLGSDAVRLLVPATNLAGQKLTALLAGAIWLTSAMLLLFSSLGIRAHGADSAPLTGEKAVTHLRTTGQYESLSAAITSARYAVKPVEDRAANPPASAFCAQNPAHGLQSTFTPEGLTFTVRTSEGADAARHTVGWRLRSLGYGTAQTPVPAGTLRSKRQRVELDRTTPAITEWFQNEPGGLEHGFTLPERPAANPKSESLCVILAVTGGLTPRADAAGQTVSLYDAAGNTVLTYAKLKVWDATGAELPASMQVADDQVTLTVAEVTARYPLTIDPTFAQQAYVKASNTESGDNFGNSVAVSGNTVVIGVPGEDSNAIGVNGNQGDNSAPSSGAAYIFTRSGTTWTQQAYLKASNTGAGDNFGVAVSVSGDTVVIGATNEASNATGVNGNQGDISAPGSGAAYVFTRSGTTWTQQAYLKASNTGSNDRFAASLSVSGDTVMVGAPAEDSNATGVNGNQSDNSAFDSGAAYVFTRSGTAWTQQAYLKASNTGANDTFGESVSLSGDTVVVGAYGEDSNATTVNGNQSDNSAAAAGAAYVFTRSGTAWTQQAYLKASNAQNNGGPGDIFGDSVSVSGDTVVVSAPNEYSNATGVNGNQSDNSAPFAGAAYVFTRSGTTWTQQAYLKASNTGANDRFGVEVSASGNTVVVGALFEASNATGINGNQSDNSTPGSGAAYVFTRSGTTWMQQAYLKASNPGADDYFGNRVSVSGETIVIGASSEDSNASGVNGDQTNNSASNAGAAYVFAVDCIPTQIPLVLFNTGVDSTGAVLANGAVDPHYAVTINPDSGSPNAYVVNGYGNVNTTVSKWIGPSTSGFGVGGTGNPYSYQITFDVPCLDNVVITGRWAADNNGSIFLNANTTPEATLTGLDPLNYQSWHSFTINSGFRIGSNTLTFVVFNDPNFNPTSLRVELSGSATCCCGGPATQTVTIPPGACMPVTCQVAATGGNAIGNPLFLDTTGWASANGDSTQVPNLLVRNPCPGSGGFTTCFYFNDGTGIEGWFTDIGAEADSIPWNPGEVMTICNNTATPLTVTLAGTRLCAPIAKTLTPCCLYQLGSQVLGSDTFDNITGHPASYYTGVEVYRSNPNGTASPFPGSPGGYDLHTYTAGGWSPPFPALNPGESVYIKVECNTVVPGIQTFGPGAVITGDNIVWTLPCGTDVTHLSPTYTLSPQTTGDPPSGTIRDFTTPQTYTVYDDVTQNVIETYTVTVRLQGPPQPFLLFNTGVDANAEVLAVGAVDPHYTLTARPPGSGTNALAVNAAGGWLANTTTSQWIAPGASGVGPSGSYTYRMAFNVPCVDNAVITGRWAADNDGSIVLNGSATPVSTLTGGVPGNFTTWHPFTVTSGLTAGLNTLDFNVINNGGRTGLRVELTGTTTCCCPPTNTVLLNTGYDQNNSAVYPLQAADAFWWVTSDPTQPGTTLPRPATVIQRNGAWSQPMANSQWLSSYPTEVNNLNGEYVFETYFCLQPDASNVVVNVCLRADDAAEVFLNDNLLVATPPLYSYGAPTPACGTVSMAANQSWFLTGQNVIRVRVHNIQAVAMGVNLTGSVTGSGLALQPAACCRPASGISGQKYFDFNQNGSRDPGEPALPGWTMQLSNGATATTDVNGYYYFQNLVSGTYTVTEVLQAPWTQTAPAGGSHTLTLGVAQQVNGRDFGNWKPNDPNCPVSISCPSDIVAECTGSGAEVAFNVTATSPCNNNPVNVICTPPSTTLFPIGTTTVKCTALDSQQNWAECSFTVTVMDTTPPVITCPANIVVDSCTNVPVVFAPTATDSCSKNVTVVCTPPSGSVFGAGTTTTVTCVATDEAGLSSSCQFTVTVNLRGAAATQTVTIPAGGCMPVTCQVAGAGGNAISNPLFLDPSEWAVDSELSGLRLQLLSPCSGTVSEYFYEDGTLTGSPGWYDFASLAPVNGNLITWSPGEVMTICNSSATPMTVTLAGTKLCAPVAKELTQCCFYLLGSQVLGADTFDNITGHPASHYTGVEVYRIVPNGTDDFPGSAAGSGGYTRYDYGTGVWSPPFPAALNAGERVWIRVNCCPPTETVLLNTGYNQNTGAVYPLQAGDAFWWVTSDPTQPGTTLPRPATVIQPNGAWSQPMANSRWLSSYPTEVNNLNGDYVFETYFCLQPDASNVVVNVCLRADDAADVFLNGNLLVSTPPLYSYGAPTPACGTVTMAANSGWFLTGQNVIQVRVRNIQAVAMGMNLTGSVTGSGLALQSAACCRPASGISGQKYFDFNQNGSRDAGEPALPGWTMQLSNGATAITDANGYYYFQNLAAGTYTVTEVPQATWTQSAPAGGSHTVTLGVAQQVNGRDFGNWKPNDPNCPVLISCPGDIVAECTGSGAEVAFNTTATSQCGNNPVKVICTPPSTTLFPVGTTTVHCTALDSQNNWAVCSFTVTVVDTTPPVITCPNNIVVESCTNVPVVFAATATDGCSGNVTMVCTPPSGSVFGAGTTTTVTCVATDEAGLSSSCSFTVTVQGPPRSFLLANTGVGPSAAVLADGLVDPHYTLTANPNGGSPNALASSAYAGWLANTTTSKWISPGANGAGATGTYTYRMTFNVPSLENAVITGQWAADNNGSIVLNGSATPVATLTGSGSGNFTTWHPFTINTGLIEGMNTLDFNVINESGPTGLRVELTGTMTCCSVIIDSDGDGISDAWELLYGLDPLNPNDARLDLDGDGMTNFKEYAFGLNPTSGTSVNPITQMLNKTTGEFRYTRRDPSLTGITYTVQTSTDLVLWTDDTIATAGQTIAAVSGDIQTMAATLSGSPQTAPRLFVRVKAELDGDSCVHP